MLLTFEEGETERRERTEEMPPLCGCRGCTGRYVYNESDGGTGLPVGPAEVRDGNGSVAQPLYGLEPLFPI
jgi:hypothetical protein